MLSVLPNLTLFHVVSFRILETLFEILFDFREVIVPIALQFPFDIVQCYGAFDDVVIVGVLPLRWETEEISGQDSATARMDVYVKFATAQR